MRIKLLLLLSITYLLLIANCSAQQNQNISDTTITQRSQNPNDIILNYERFLRDETISHRNYTQEYYSEIFNFILQLGWILTILLALLGSFIGWQGWKTKQDLIKNLKVYYSKQLDNLIEERTNKISDSLHSDFNEKIQTIFQEMEQKAKEIEELKKNLGEILRQEFIQIASRTQQKAKLLESRTRIKFITLNGDTASIFKSQKCKCIKNGMQCLYENYKVVGEFKLEQSTPQSNVFYHTGGSTVTTIISPPLKKGNVLERSYSGMLKNTFKEKKEWWIIYQYIDTELEILEIIFLPDRRFAEGSIKTYELLGESQEEIKTEIKHISQQEVKIVLPPGKKRQYKVEWEFID